VTFDKYCASSANLQPICIKDSHAKVPQDPHGMLATGSHIDTSSGQVLAVVTKDYSSMTQSWCDDSSVICAATTTNVPTSNSPFTLE
jgi:hypothetical protein